MIVDLIGDRVILAGLAFSVIMVVLGYFVSQGGYPIRAATSMIQPGSNAGPAFAALAIAFDNDPAVLGAVTAIIFMQIVVGGVGSAWIGKQFGPPLEDEGGDGDGSDAGGVEAGDAAAGAEAGA